MAILNKHRGAKAELIACTWLLENGFEVCRNVSACGPADIVVVYNGEAFLLDVKSSGNAYLSKEQYGLGVIRLIVKNGKCRLMITRPSGESRELPEERKCKHCGEPFTVARNSRQHFHSSDCRRQWFLREIESRAISANEGRN